MSLPTPNLDVRNFQQIVDDVKRQISLHCPDWTDHNVSDPGVTLIELFASMTEMMLFRANQVPEKNYIKFLELLGIGLETPQPARTKLHFLLSRAIEDYPGQEENELRLFARRTVAATLRTELDEAIEFSTEEDLVMVRPRLTQVLSIGATDDLELVGEIRSFAAVNAPASPAQGPFPIFSRVPATGDAVYLGFEADISSNLVQLETVCVRTAATGLNETYPAQLWEIWNGYSSRWDRLQVVEDQTAGFNRSGHITLAMPSAVQERSIGGHKGRWIRCRYTVDETEMPPRGAAGLRPSPYQKSPEVTSIFASVIGGVASASHATTIREEILGESDGTPGQVFKLAHSPVLQLERGETLLVGVEDPSSPDDPILWTEWLEVSDFAQSSPTDRHFVCDYLTGDVYLGPSLVQPDGSSRLYGSFPAEGAILKFSAYRVGGGTNGNVREGKIKVLKSAFPYIAEVVNPEPAFGGTDRETLERAKMRAKEVLQVRNRAVTVEDYEFLAQKATSAVGRARCLQPHIVSADSSGLQPGTVRVLLVPRLPKSLLMPRPKDLEVPDKTIAEVKRFLDERRLLTTQLEVGEPEYVFVSTDIRLVADPRADADAVSQRVHDRIALFLHPLFGGPTGEGWPFQRTLTLADLYAQIGAVPGVAFLLDSRIYVSEVVDRHDWLLSNQRRVPNSEGVRLKDGQLLCSRSHTIRAVPMSRVGLDEDGNPIGE